MEYVYSAMLLHAAKKDISEASVKKVLEAAGVHSDDGKIKALVASLKEVNIDEAIQKAAVAQVAVAPSASHDKHEAKKETAAPKEEKKTEEEAAAGLSSLFG